MNDRTIAKKYLQLEQSANTRGLNFNLSLQSVRNLLRSKKCYYTGASLNNIHGHPYKLTIDRVDNTKGYVIGNVVACSRVFNSLKGSLTIKDIKILYKKVIL